MGLVRMEEHRVRPVRMSPSWPSAPRYAPYDKGRFQFTLGIRELDPAEWIEIDDQYAPQLAEKRRLLAERPGEVSGAVPGSLWAQAECLDMLLDHLARHRPDTITARSEEHTSALQSLMRTSSAVLCLKKTHNDPQ